MEVILAYSVKLTNEFVLLDCLGQLVACSKKKIRRIRICKVISIR